MNCHASNFHIFGVLEPPSLSSGGHFGLREPRVRDSHLTFDGLAIEQKSYIYIYTKITLFGVTVLEVRDFGGW